MTNQQEQTEKSIEKKAYKQALQELRQQYFQELDKTMRRLISIRDDPDSTEKGVIEACKQIARILGALQPETPAQAAASAQQAAKETQSKSMPSMTWQHIQALIADDKQQP
jgi:HPt (histidine-containing phosphotransfer) domain-containing protein